MTDEQLPQETQSDQADELALLKERAKLMGIKFSNNISIGALQAKIDAKIAGVPDDVPVPDSAPDAVSAVPVQTPAVKMMTLREYMVMSQTKLRRIRVQNLDPKKKNWAGEVLTVGNEFLGTIRKYVPYGDACDDGWHVPECIYQFMLSRRFQHIRTFKDPKTKQDRQTSALVREYSIELLPDLTAEERQQLAAAQAAAG